MKWISFVTTVIALAAAVSPAHASGPVSVYALIDKVTMLPSAEQPDWIRIDGVFIVAEGQGGGYGMPRRGYLYLSGASADARREWADLQSVAGTGQVVGFGSSFTSVVRVRPNDEKQESADVYPFRYGNGVTRINADQPRAKALLDFKDR